MIYELISQQVLLSAMGTLIILTLAGISVIFCERAGIINIAIEGTMLISAFAASSVCYYTGSPWLGVVAALALGLSTTFLNVIFSMVLRVNQVISGLTVNILAGGITVYLMKVWFNKIDEPLLTDSMPKWGMVNPIFYFAAVLILICWVLFYKTPFGLRIRAYSLNPKSLEMSGVKVNTMRYTAYAISGILAGLAGAYLSIGDGNIFLPYMTNGKGFIAIAAVILGGWQISRVIPISIVISYYIAIQPVLSKISIAGFTIPSALLQVILYTAMIIFISVYSRKINTPAPLEIFYTDKSQIK